MSLRIFPPLVPKLRIGWYYYYAGGSEFLAQGYKPVWFRIGNLFFRSGRVSKRPATSLGEPVSRKLGSCGDSVAALLSHSLRGDFLARPERFCAQAWQSFAASPGQ